MNYNKRQKQKNKNYKQPAARHHLLGNQLIRDATMNNKYYEPQKINEPQPYYLQQYQMQPTVPLCSSSYLSNSSYELERGIIADSQLSYLNRHQPQPSHSQQYQVLYYNTSSSFGYGINRDFITNNQFNHLDRHQPQPIHEQQYQGPDAASSSDNKLCRDIITGTQLDKLEKYSSEVYQSHVADTQSPWYGFQYGMSYLTLQQVNQQLSNSFQQSSLNLEQNFNPQVESLLSCTSREECYPQAQSTFYPASDYSQREILHTGQTASQLPEQFYPLHNFQDQQNFFNNYHTFLPTNTRNLMNNDRQISEFIQQQRLPAILEASLAKFGAQSGSSDTECRQYKLFN